MLRLAHFRFACVASLFVWLLASSLTYISAEEPTGSPAATSTSATVDPALRRQIKDVTRLAYSQIYEGWSTDEVLLQDELNAKFLAACRERLPDVQAFEFNWSLLNLRKAGELSDLKATRRRSDRHDDYLHAAEIAARFLEDKHKVNTDRIICDPQRRAEFDKLATSIAPDVEPYKLRKAAFALRKSRRLSPELVLRVAAWKKDVLALSAEQVIADPKQLPDGPGVYIIRDATGYLYVGESGELRTRIVKHLDRSDRQSLAGYFSEKGIKDITIEAHVFDPNSDARQKPLRRAYESELIRSRKPRFNLAP